MGRHIKSHPNWKKIDMNLSVQNYLRHILLYFSIEALFAERVLVNNYKQNQNKISLICTEKFIFDCMIMINCYER